MSLEIKTYYLELINGQRTGALAALLSFLLFLFSFVYGLFLRLVLSCYQIGLFKSAKPDCWVISVGNITWGGTGKTPLVEALAEFFQEKGRRPAILIRGYGKDEVSMLKSRLKDVPVLAGTNRLKTARQAKAEYNADIIILDDGFQHWRLKRDVDLVLLDASFPFGNRRLIPGGALREPLARLNRADAFVLTKSDLAEGDIESIKRELRGYNPRAPIYQARHQPRYLRNLNSNEKIEPSTLKDKRLALLCGLAQPESLAKAVQAQGARVVLKFYFPDHHQYCQEDLLNVISRCRQNQVGVIITTEKDAPKLLPLLKSVTLEAELWALGIEFRLIKDENNFFLFAETGRDPDRPYSILILSDGKAGHLNQGLGLGRIIQDNKSGEGAGVETKIVQVKFKNGFCRALLAACSLLASPACRGCLGCLRFCLKQDSFKELIQTPADILISAGSSLSSVNLFLGYQNKARKVMLMKPPLLNLGKFDLVIVPEHDRLKTKGNVLTTRIAPNLIDRQYLKEQADKLVLNSKLQASGQTGPVIGLLIGGDSLKYRMSVPEADKMLAQLQEAARDLNSSLLVTTSRRTSPEIEALVKAKLSDFSPCKLLVIANQKNIPETVGGILGLSDIIVVSGESISMVSEAVSAQKYVLAWLPEKKVNALTKQERFLAGLAEEGVLKNVQVDELCSEIKKTWGQKPEIIQLKDRELIAQAVSRIL